MPRVTVICDGSSEREPRTLLDETIHPDELDAGRHADAFVARLGWAIVEAEDEESRRRGDVVALDRAAANG